MTDTRFAETARTALADWPIMAVGVVLAGGLPSPSLLPFAVALATEPVRSTAVTVPIQRPAPTPAAPAQAPGEAVRVPIVWADPKATQRVQVAWSGTAGTTASGVVVPIQLAQYMPEQPAQPLDSQPVVEDASDEEDARSLAVLSRPRPEYDPTGIDTDLLWQSVFGGTVDEGSSGYILYPTLKSSIGWTDNVYLTDDDKRSDYFYKVRPELMLRSNWDNHRLDLGLYVETERYFEEADNDWTDYLGSIIGVYNLEEVDEIGLQIEGGRLHESRGDPDSPPDIENVNEFYLFRAMPSYKNVLSDIEFKLTGQAASFSYEDNGPINNQDRNYWLYEIRGRVEYDYSIDLSLFLETAYNWRIYGENRDRFGFVRDSDGYDARIGVEYDSGGVARFELGVGYIAQSYDDDRFDSTDGFDVRGRLLWNPLELMTITAEVERGVQETAFPGVPGILQSRVGLGLDYEITDQVLFSSRGSWINQDFRDLDRVDDVFDLRAGVTYLMNQYSNLEAAYEYTGRQTDFAGGRYTGNRIYLRLVLQL